MPSTKVRTSCSAVAKPVIQRTIDSAGSHGQKNDQAVRSPKNYLGGLRMKIALLDEPGALRSSMTKSFGYFLSRSLTPSRSSFSRRSSLASVWMFAWATPRHTTLPPALKSLVMVAMMGAAGHNNELRVHLKGALKNGCSTEQIQDVLLLLTMYCGIPAANEAHRIAADVLNEEKR